MGVATFSNKSFETAEGLLDKGADAIDNYFSEIFDEQPGITPVPSVPSGPYIPGEPPPGESPATRLIDELNRMDYRTD